MDLLPLTGFTVAVTATRRREELVSLLQRRGARTVEAPAIRIVGIEHDEVLRNATQECVHAPPDVVVATTGIGFRGWMSAAQGWGLGEALHQRLAACELLVRGPKAKGAVRAAGLTEAWSPASESTDEVLRRLLDEGVEGRRVAVQLHGEPLPDFCSSLRAAGAEVIEIPVYRWVPAETIRPLRRLVGQIAAAQVDCVTFTSAPAVASLLRVAREEGRVDGMLVAMRGPVLVACVGPVTAAQIEVHQVSTVQPARARLGALVEAVAEELPARRTRSVSTGEHRLELRGNLALVDGRPIDLTHRQAGVLSALVAGGGRVLTRGELLRAAWPQEARDEHAVEMTVTRLRSALGPAGTVVETVVKRGYRLAAASGAPSDP